MQLYDSIGKGYRNHRIPDPRIAAYIDAALGEARSVVNVGAGAGSYEPVDRRVVAIEPSERMIAQRPAQAAPAVRAVAGDLPLGDESFDAALAILTIHHWPDLRRGLSELRRVARDRVVLLTCDTSALRFWLVDYFPQIPAIDAKGMPTLAALEALLGECEIVGVPVPHDCIDGFLGAYWRRPHAYLEEEVRRAISMFAMLPDVEAGVAALAADLESGAWASRYADVLELETLDLGYRVVVARRH